VAAKIIAFLITLLLNIAAGVVILFMMLVAMNGYSGSDAEWGLGAYIILATLVSLIAAGLAAWSVHILTNRQFSAAVSALIAIPFCSLAGIILQIISSLIGIGISEYVRVNY